LAQSLYLPLLAYAPTALNQPTLLIGY